MKYLFLKFLKPFTVFQHFLYKIAFERIAAFFKYLVQYFVRYGLKFSWFPK